ncbi:MAG TPA: ribosome assembly RNA-binding protein YhbY [Mariprofundaceae bacterium]|nr:ribosome assembly RNA-binding protein YhbY [Mariprofundaceae bacterium]
MSLSSSEKKALKARAHHLKPVVRIGQKGVTDTVVEETAQCLERHELIKVHVQEGERDERMACARELASATGAELVHYIGKVFVLFRPRMTA